MKKAKTVRPLQDKIHDVVAEDGIVLVHPLGINTYTNIHTEPQMVVTEQGMITVKPPADDNAVCKESAKKVTTYDTGGKPNGHLIELFKDGKFTTTYLSAIGPGKFKGYHLHKVRTANYVCVKGKVKIILYTAKGREEHILSADSPERLHIPVNTPTGLSNEWKTEAWIINDPLPAYDPDLKGEQVDYTEEQCEARLYLKK